MSGLDLDALEALARACVAANEKVVAAPNAYTRWDAEEERKAPHEDLGLHGAEVCALITRLRAAESEVDAAREALGGSFWTTEGLADGIRRKTAATERDADARLRAGASTRTGCRSTLHRRLRD